MDHFTQCFRSSGELFVQPMVDSKVVQPYDLFHPVSKCPLVLKILSLKKFLKTANMIKLAPYPQNSKNWQETMQSVWRSIVVPLKDFTIEFQPPVHALERQTFRVDRKFNNSAKDMLKVFEKCKWQCVKECVRVWETKETLIIWSIHSKNHIQNDLFHWKHQIVHSTVIH